MDKRKIAVVKLMKGMCEGIKKKAVMEKKRKLLVMDEKENNEENLWKVNKIEAQNDYYNEDSRKKYTSTNK